MPRQKKTEETNTRRKSKKVVEEEEEDVTSDEVIEEPKSGRKTASKAKPAKKGKKRVEDDDEDSDELSDLPVDDIEALEDSGDNDEVVTNNKPDRPPRKIIDPKSRIGSLGIDDILAYLIQVGEQNMNPQLKYGAINLLGQLSGRRRRPPQQNFIRRGTFGSPRGTYMQRGGGGGGRGGGRGGLVPLPRGPRNQGNEDDVYGEADG